MSSHKSSFIAAAFLGMSDLPGKWVSGFSAQTENQVRICRHRGRSGLPLYLCHREGRRGELEGGVDVDLLVRSLICVFPIRLHSLRFRRQRLSDFCISDIHSSVICAAQREPQTSRLPGVSLVFLSV